MPINVKAEMTVKELLHSRELNDFRRINRGASLSFQLSFCGLGELQVVKLISCLLCVLLKPFDVEYTNM